MDYYTGDVIRKENYVGGKRKYEFLKLYLIPERTREDKAKNEVTLALAKAIQSKRIVEVQNDAHGFQNTNKSRVNLLDYLENVILSIFNILYINKITITTPCKRNRIETKSVF